MFDRLDYIYMPSRDVAADTRYFGEVLGARLVFAIESTGVRVAMVELAPGSPRILLADHVEGDQPILIYRVARLGEALSELEARGWKRQAILEIPTGPCCSFRGPGGHRLAVYELTRPQVEASFSGRRDF